MPLLREVCSAVPDRKSTRLVWERNWFQNLSTQKALEAASPLFLSTVPQFLRNYLNQSFSVIAPGHIPAPAPREKQGFCRWRITALFFWTS